MRSKPFDDLAQRGAGGGWGGCAIDPAAATAQGARAKTATKAAAASRRDACRLPPLRRTTVPVDAVTAPVDHGGVAICSRATPQFSLGIGC